MNFMQYRGFGFLHARVLLFLQRELEGLETELDEMDRWERDFGESQKLQCKWRDDIVCEIDQAPSGFPFQRTRPEVFAELRSKLIVYDETLLKTKAMATLQRPSESDWRGVKDWILDHAPLVAREQKFILMKEDIVTLRAGRESANFDDLVEKILLKLDTFLSERCGCIVIQNIFKTPELREKTTNRLLQYYDPDRVSKLVNSIITTIIFVLLVLPVIALYKISSTGGQASPIEAIAILIVFTLLFGVAMSGLTKATRQELFAASAAYCAVLVVFIGNFNNQTVTLAKDE